MSFEQRRLSKPEAMGGFDRQRTTHRSSERLIQITKQRRVQLPDVGHRFPLSRSGPLDVNLLILSDRPVESARVIADFR